MRVNRVPAFRVLRLLLFAVSLASSGAVKRFYRPWAYEHDVSDLGLADWSPSILYVFGIGMLLAAILNFWPRLRTLRYHTMIGAGAGALVYEITQALRPDRTFSWTDVIATIIGAAGALLVEKWVSTAESRPVRASKETKLS